MFKPNESAAPAAQTRGNFEPAIGFLNLYLPSKDGNRVKLGAIPLKASKEREKALFDALTNKENTEAIMAAILSKLVIDFQPVEQGEGKHFDLGL